MTGGADLRRAPRGRAGRREEALAASFTVITRIKVRLRAMSKVRGVCVVVCASVLGCTKPATTGGGSSPQSGGGGGAGGDTADANRTPRERQTIREAQEYIDANLTTKMSPCGTPITIDMAWDRFDFASWHKIVDERKAVRAQTADAGSLCLLDVLGDGLGYLCQFPEGKDIQPELKKLTTVRCIYKPCEQLPRSVPNQTTPDPGATAGYALADGGATLEVSYCTQLSVAGSYDSRYFVKKMYGL
jgi:hypothetical protein